MSIPREDLYIDFGDGKIPTGSQFHALISSIVSRYDDGIDKVANSALKISAGSDQHAPVLSLSSNGEIDPSWVLSLNVGEADGLNFGQGNAAANSVLFLDRNSGKVGVGTIAPQKHLTIYEDADAEVGSLIHNPNVGASAFTIHRLKTDNSEGVLFKNSSARTADGGANTMTLRNDHGDLRLQSQNGNGSLILKGDTGHLGVNKLNPESALDVAGDLGLNGHSINLVDDDGSVSSLGKRGVFWHGKNQQHRELYGIYKSNSGWEPGAYQQLKVQFATGIQLGAGTGENAGHDKSYVDIVNGKGLMVSSGNLGVGTTNPIGKVDIVGGATMFNSNITNNSTRPPLGNIRIPAELAGYSSKGRGWDDGFLRLSAGGGTHSTVKSFIDLTGYSKVAEMDQNIRFGTAGQERIRIDKLGKVGIGVANTQSKLDVAGNVTIGQTFAGRNVASTNGLLVEGDTDLRSRLLVNGSAGVGTSSPAGKLHVVTSNSDGNVGTWGTGQLVAGEAGTKGGGVGISYSGTNSTGYLSSLSPGVAWRDLGIRSKNTIFYGNGTAEVMRLVDNGNVGIGTATPKSKLGINGNLAIGTSFAGSTAAPTNGLLVQGDTSIRGSAGVSGVLTIGTSGNKRSLELRTDGASPYASRLIFGSDDTGWRFAISKRSSIGNKPVTDFLMINDKGSVGIGASDPVGKLHVITGDSNGDVGGWTENQFLVGKAARSGSASGAVGISYSKADSTGYISSLSPATSWRNLGIRAHSTIFYSGGRTEAMRIASNGNVGVDFPTPKFNLDVNGNIGTNGGSLYLIPHGSSVSTDRDNGIFWQTKGSNVYRGYGIRRTKGPWDGPNYQQLHIQFDTGITLGAGTTDNGGYGKSYVEIVNGKGLMVSSGKVAIGGVSTSTDSKLELLSGAFIMNGGITNAHNRPAVTKARIIGEIHGRSNAGYGADDGFLRLSAGGGTNAGTKAFIDLSGYSTKADMNRNIVFGTAGVERMRLDISGNLGIGTKTPKFPIHITRASNGGNHRHGYLNTSGRVGVYNGAGIPVSIWTTGRMVCPEFNAISDRRVKSKINAADGILDLQLLQRLKVSEYNFKDEIANGSVRQKGLIAQELEEVFPSAVSTQTELIPNIFDKPQKAKIINSTIEITMSKPHQLETGDKISLYVGDDKVEANVIVNSSNKFTIEDWTKKADAIFVYGKWVDDFRVVDYNKVLCLNLSATQAINKKVDALEVENNSLREEVAAIKAMLNASKNKFEA